MANDDTLLRDVSDLMEIHDDSALWNTESHSNKHVTLLLFRDGDHLNLLRVIDRGEANSPVSGAMRYAFTFTFFCLTIKVDFSFIHIYFSNIK